MFDGIWSVIVFFGDIVVMNKVLVEDYEDFVVLVGFLLVVMDMVDCCDLFRDFIDYVGLNSIF